MNNIYRFTPAENMQSTTGNVEHTSLKMQLNMKIIFRHWKVIGILVVMVMVGMWVNGATRYSRTSGTWNSTSTWATSSGGNGGASVPVAGDIVYIERGFTVTVNITNAACATLYLGSTTTNSSTGTLAFATTGNPALIVSGTIQLGATSRTARDGTITFQSGSTLTAGNIILGASGTYAAQGNINMALGGTLNTGSLSVGTGSGTWTQGVGTVVMTATNTLPATIFTSFNNLTVNSGTTTSGRNFSVAGTLMVDGIFTPGPTHVISGGGTLTGSGTVQVSKTGGNDFLTQYTVTTKTLTNLTVEYTVLTGGQVVSSTTYGNLNLSNTSGTNTTAGNITVNGVLTTTAGGTLNMGTYQLLGTLTDIVNDGTIQTQAVSSAIPTGKAWGGTINYNSGSGGQSVISGTYNNLLLSNTSGTQTASGTLQVDGELITTSGSTLNMVTYQLKGALNTITNGGIIQTQNSSSTPLTTGKTWGGTVEYNATSGGQTVMAGTYATLLLSNTSGAQTASGNLTVNTALTTTSGGTLNMATNQLTGSLSSITNNGTIRTQAASAAVPANKTWSGTVQYDAATGGQSVITGTYATLSMGNTSGIQTASGNLIINTALTTTAGGTLNMATNQLSGSLSSITNNGTIRTQAASAAVPAGKTWNGTVQYDAAGGGQSVITGTYATLSMGNTSGTQTASGTIMATTLNTTAGGTLNMVTYAISGLSGVGNAGTLRTQNTSSTPFTSGLSWGGTVTFDGSTGQTLPAPTSIFNNLTISNTSGVTSAADQEVSGILSLTTNPNATTGCLNMATFTLEMGMSGTTAGVGDVSGIVKRTGIFIGDEHYSFGNQFTTMTFINTGTQPKWVSCKIVLGAALPDKPGSILRYYNFAADQSVSYTDEVILNLHYLDGAELNSNTESNLVLWDDHSGVVVHEHGKSNHDEMNNWVGLAGLSITYVAPSADFTSKKWSLANSASIKNTWSGAANTEWNNTANWTGGIVPTSSSDVLIPAGKPLYPVLTAISDAEVKTIEIEANATLTASGQILIIHGSAGALSNDGTITQTGSGKVVFANGTITNQVTISGTGTTNFYILETTSNTYLETATGTTLGIAGTIQQGTGSLIDFTSTVNTVNYNGDAQILTDPVGPGTEKGYYNLTLTGTTGAKTFPAILTIAGDFTNNLSGGTITAGSSTVTMNGVGHTQNIGGGATSTAFANLTIANTSDEVITSNNITIASGKYLTINSNAVFVPGATKTVGGSGTLTGYGKARVTMINSGSDLFSQYALGNLILTNLTVDFIGSGDQTIDAWDYFNLTISANGTRTVTLVEANSNLDMSINISGTFLPSITNTYIVTGSLVTFNGSSSQTIPVFNYYDLTSTSTGARVLANTGIIGIKGLFTPGTNTYTIAGSTINFNGLAQDIPSFTFNNLSASTAFYTKTAKGDLSVNGTLTVASSVTLYMSTFALLGTLNTINNSGTIKTSVFSTYANLPIPEGKTWGGTVEYFCITSSRTQKISAGSYNNLTMSGTRGKVANGDLTVTGVLNLSANQLTTQGILETSTYTLNLGQSATITGPGDVTGTVKRSHVFTGGIDYSFGSQYTTINFLNTGAKPDWVSCKISIGDAPVWNTSAIQRYYHFEQSGGTDKSILSLHYLDTELNGNTNEANLEFWVDYDGLATGNNTYVIGNSSTNSVDNFVSIYGVQINSYAQPGREFSLAYSNLSNISWTGNSSADHHDWALPGNWLGGVPTATDPVIIPSGLTYYPTKNTDQVTYPSTALTLEIQTGASITVDSYSITITGDANAWVNNGTFNPGTGTVIFNKGNTSTPATLAGTTDFYNLSVGTDTKIQPATASTIRIGNVLSTGSGSILDFNTNANTVEYNGSNSQTVVVPSNGYSSLKFSGSGAKTLPTLSIYGDFTNNGSFSASGTTITFGGAVDQIISGTSASTFNNLTCNNISGVTLSSDQLTTISGTMLINSTCKFNIGAGRYLTANTITNNGGLAGLTIKSDANSTGSLLNSTSGVPATVERYIANDQHWHFLSSPVNSQPVWPSFAPDPGVDLSWGAYNAGSPYNWDFYYYNPNALIASQLYWVNLRKDNTGAYNNGADMEAGSNAGYGSGTPNFVVGRGYLVAYADGWTSGSPETHNFTGNLNTNISAQPIAFNGGNTYNLMGNPYPSAIDWNASSGWSRGTLTNDSEGNYFWIYSDASGNYGAFNGSTGTLGVSQYIAPGQAFFVKASAAGTLGMTDATRTHNGQEWLKKTSSENNLVRLTIEDDANTYSDEMIVEFDPSYSGNTGTEKFWSFYTTAPELYSVKNGNNYTIDNYPEVTENLIVPIAAKTGVEATYTITATNIEEFNLTSYIWLRDLKTGIKTNLKQTPAYSFSGKPTDDRNRFQLIFGVPNGTEEEAVSNFTIYAYENTIYISNDKANEPYTVMVSNMLGQILTRTKLSGNDLNQVQMNQSPGVYVVTVISEGTAYSKKVVIR